MNFTDVKPQRLIKIEEEQSCTDVNTEMNNTAFHFFFIENKNKTVQPITFPWIISLLYKQHYSLESVDCFCSLRKSSSH